MSLPPDIPPGPPLSAYENTLHIVEGQQATSHEPNAITPTQFQWAESRSLPPREWLYGHHLCRKYVSATIAPGGVGKSTLTIADALAMVSGRDLLGARPHCRLRVWLWNGEDPADELMRRVIASMIGHGIEPSDVSGRLYLDSGRDTPIRIGTSSPTGPQIAQPVIEGLCEAISQRNIDVLIVDPFVSVHAMPENDNGAMDAAVKAFALVAHRTGCAIDLVHHSRKLNGADADIDAARGGSAIAGAVRAARALNVMSKDVATSFGVEEADRRSHVRIDDAKANLAPASVAKWFKLESVGLGNGTQDRPEDFVAVATAWSPPDAFDGITTEKLLNVQRAIDKKELRESPQATKWVGYEIARVLDMNVERATDKARIKLMIKTWLATGALAIEEGKDSRSGRPAKYVVVGAWASTTP